MAETQKEVKARLSVETDGEPEAFSRAAEAVSGLSSAAGSAGAPLASITGELGRLAGSVKELGPAGESFQRFADGIDRFAKAKGVDEQRQAVEAALQAWKEFGNRVPDVLDKGGKSAKEFQSTLEALEAQQRKLADPLTQSVDKARSALENLGESVEGSFDGAEGKLVKARQRIDEYRRSLEEAKEAGKGITADQVAELDRLEGEYDDATRAIAGYAKAKADAKKDIEAAAAATQNEVGQIGSLRDIAEKASPSLGKLVGTGAAMVGAFTAGYAAGEKLRSILNSLTEGAFDAFIQKGLQLEKVADKIANGFHSIGQEAELLSNQRKIFENLGLGGFTQDVEKNQEILQAHGRTVQDSKSRLEEFAKSLGLSRQELDAQAAALTKNVALFKEANPQIDPKGFQELVKGPIQALLDAYAKLGTEVPKHLQALADAQGVTTSKVEADTQRHAEAVKGLIQSITGIVTRSTAELKEQAATVAEAVAAINKAQLSPEGLERARSEVQGLVDGFRTAREQIPEALVAAADKVGVFVAAMERANTSITPFASGTDQAAASTLRLTTSADGARASIEGLGESTLRAATNLDTGRTAIETINPVAGEAGMSLDELKAKYGDAGKSAQAAGKDVADGTKQVADGAKNLDGATREVDATGDSLGYAGDQAKAAAPALTAASDGAKTLGAQAGEAKTGVGGLAGEVETLEQRLSTLQSVLVEMATGVAEAFSNLRGLTQPILTEVQTLIAAVQQAHAEIQSLGGEGAAAAPPPPPVASH